MPRYERYHCVAIPPETIHAAVELSVRYLRGVFFLPDKAIDLLDEAAAALRITDKESSGRRVLTPRHIARVVSKASGVPAERVGEAERERAEPAGSPPQCRGHRPARCCFCCGRCHPPQPHRPAGNGRPIGAMLFLGPTGGQNAAGPHTGQMLVRQ